MFNSIQKKFVLIFLSICLCSHAYSQQKSGIVYGSVKEKLSGKTLENVNVFISGTTLGTATNQDGFYEIKFVPEGYQIVVASIIGYKVKAFEIDIVDNQRYLINFYLDTLNYMLKTIEIIQDFPEEWRENLKVFKKYFLGMTDLSEECIIENENNLEFTRDEVGNLEVKCPIKLSIINNALGYTIDCILLLFSCNETVRNVKYIYHTKFIELKPKNENEENKWIENRKWCYLRSLKRFLKAAVNLDLFNYGYIIGQSYRPFDLSLDSNYKRKSKGSFWIKEPNPVTNLQIIKSSKENKKYILTFDHYLYIDNNLTGEISWLYLLHDTSEIDEFGETNNPMSIQTFGSFANNGTANLLPKDYYFE